MRWAMPEECASPGPSISNQRMPEHLVLILRLFKQTPSVWVVHGYEAVTRGEEAGAHSSPARSSLRAAWRCDVEVGRTQELRWSVSNDGG
jgi:hypothetical protein